MSEIENEENEENEETESPKIENLYISDDLSEIELHGVVVKFREISGMEYTAIADELGLDPKNPDKIKNVDYSTRLLQKCVVEPKDLDISRLKTDVLIELSQAILHKMNMAGGLENLNER